MNYDCKKIQNALQTVVDKCVAKKFGKVEVKVRFEFVESDEVKPIEYLEMAAKVKALGLAIDIQKLKDLTGLQFIKDVEADLWTPEQAEGDESK